MFLSANHQQGPGLALSDEGMGDSLDTPGRGGHFTLLKWGTFELLLLLNEKDTFSARNCFENRCLSLANFIIIMVLTYIDMS